jgi:serine O-acetyltransferase
MTKQEYKELLRSDFLSYSSNTSLLNRFKIYKMKPGYEWSHWYRKLCYQNSRRILKPLAFFTRLHFHKVSVKYGIDIPSHIPQIGEGFHIEHFSNIVIHTDCVIGKNVTIHQGIVIGTNGRGVPTIEDDVNIGANACVIGPITVGKGSIIGAGAVVTKDVPAGATVVGNPAHVIK